MNVLQTVEYAGSWEYCKKKGLEKTARRNLGSFDFPHLHTVSSLSQKEILFFKWRNQLFLMRFYTSVTSYDYETVS